MQIKTIAPAVMGNNHHGVKKASSVPRTRITKNAAKPTPIP